MRVLALLSTFTVIISSIFFPILVESIEDGVNLWTIAKHIDVPTLSRFLAFRNFLSSENYELQPKFRQGWIYKSKLLDNWTRRLGMYGYGISVINSRGDGNCLFYALRTVLHLNNITNKDLLGYLNPDLDPAVEVAVRGLLEGDELISVLDLKRISHIFWLGFDPNDDESYQLGDMETLKAKIEQMSEIQPAVQDSDGNLGVVAGMLIAGLNMIGFRQRMETESDKRAVAQDLFKAMEEKIPQRFGDHVDIRHLQFTFQMTVLLFNREKTEINCMTKHYDYNPKFIMTIYYSVSEPKLNFH